jgi:Na+/H+-dicarboxylate symporter
MNLGSIFGAGDESPPVWAFILIVIGLIVGGIAVIVSLVTDGTSANDLTFDEFWKYILVAVGLFSVGKGISNAGKNVKAGRVEAAAIISGQAAPQLDPQSEPPTAVPANDGEEQA